MRRIALVGGRARLRARGPLVAACAVAVLSAGCAGAAGTSSVTATGRNLTIYLSAPVGAGSSHLAQDVLDAESLAFSQKAGEVTTFKLSLQRLSAPKPSDNARTAIQNTAAIAYLGEIMPGSSAETIGITNAQQLLQVSPTDTAVALTRATAAVPGAPASYLESQKTYGRTFARVVPSTVQEAHAQATQMQGEGVRSLYLTDDGTPYGRALSAAIKADAAGMSVRTGPPQASPFSSAGADALFFATASQPVARALFTAVAAAHPTAKLFGSSALADPTFAASLGAARLNLVVSAPGLAPGAAVARQFLHAFQSTYHHVPVPQAVFGYEAMSAVIDVLKESGPGAGNRAAVVHNFFAIRNRQAPIGSYSIDVNGDTSLAPFVFERLRGGRFVPIGQH